jgi:hypothetical protein
MRLVILESPFAGNVEENIEYARRCVKDSLHRGEAPIASHLLYTQPGILDDTIPEERQLGIDAGLAWRAVAEGSVIYIDKGLSRGMEYGVIAAIQAGIPIEVRSIDNSPGVLAWSEWVRELTDKHTRATKALDELAKLDQELESYEDYR